jgi:hypothetical protein
VPDRPSSHPSPAKSRQQFETGQIATCSGRRSHKAQLVIEVQKKVTALLDLLAGQNKRGST